MFLPMPIVIPFLGGGGPPKNDMDRLELMGAIYFVIAVIGGAGHALNRWLTPRACQSYRGYIDCSAGEIFLYGFSTIVAVMAALLFVTILFFALRKIWRAHRSHGLEAPGGEKS